SSPRLTMRLLRPGHPTTVRQASRSDSAWPPPRSWTTARLGSAIVICASYGRARKSGATRSGRTRPSRTVSPTSGRCLARPARYAAACLADGDPDIPVAASVAKSYCSAATVRIAEECIQMHGGLGFTGEHPAHLYLKRAKADAVALGTPRAHH